MSSEPSILTTTVGSYPVPDWLPALPSEQARLDATRVVFDMQRQAGIDLPTDGELYRFDVNHPDTNGMIEYFIRPMAGIRSQVGRSDHESFARKSAMKFRRKAAGVVEQALGEGSLNLLADCELAAGVSGGPFKFTVTSPYMLARTLLDNHYRDFDALLMGIAGVLAQQVAGLPCDCLQVDEANIPGNPADAPLAAEAINACWMPSTERAPCICASATMAGRPFRRASGARWWTSSISCTWTTWCWKWRTARRKIWSR